MQAQDHSSKQTTMDAILFFFSPCKKSSCLAKIAERDTSSWVFLLSCRRAAQYGWCDNKGVAVTELRSCRLNHGVTRLAALYCMCLLYFCYHSKITVMMHFVNIKTVCLTSHRLRLASALIHARDDWELPQVKLLCEGEII